MKKPAARPKAKGKSKTKKPPSKAQGDGDEGEEEEETESDEEISEDETPEPEPAAQVTRKRKKPLQLEQVPCGVRMMDGKTGRQPKENKVENDGQKADDSAAAEKGPQANAKAEKHRKNAEELQRFEELQKKKADELQQQEIERQKAEKSAELQKQETEKSAELQKQEAEKSAELQKQEAAELQRQEAEKRAELQKQEAEKMTELQRQEAEKRAELQKQEAAELQRQEAEKRAELQRQEAEKERAEEIQRQEAEKRAELQRQEAEKERAEEIQREVLKQKAQKLQNPDAFEVADLEVELEKEQQSPNNTLWFLNCISWNILKPYKPLDQYVPLYKFLWCLAHNSDLILGPAIRSNKLWVFWNDSDQLSRIPTQCLKPAPFRVLHANWNNTLRTNCFLATPILFHPFLNRTPCDLWWQLRMVDSQNLWGDEQKDIILQAAAQIQQMEEVNASLPPEPEARPYLANKAAVHIPSTASMEVGGQTIKSCKPLTFYCMKYIFKFVCTCFRCIVCFYLSIWLLVRSF